MSAYLWTEDGVSLTLSQRLHVASRLSVTDVDALLDAYVGVDTKTLIKVDLRRCRNDHALVYFRATHRLNLRYQIDDMHRRSLPQSVLAAFTGGLDDDVAVMSSPPPSQWNGNDIHIFWRGPYTAGIAQTQLRSQEAMTRDLLPQDYFHYLVAAYDAYLEVVRAHLTDFRMSVRDIVDCIQRTHGNDVDISASALRRRGVPGSIIKHFGYMVMEGVRTTLASSNTSDPSMCTVPVVTASVPSILRDCLDGTTTTSSASTTTTTSSASTPTATTPSTAVSTATPSTAASTATPSTTNKPPMVATVTIPLIPLISQIPQEGRCQHVLVKGPSKGKLCNQRCVPNENVCGRHLKSSPPKAPFRPMTEASLPTVIVAPSVIPPPKPTPKAVTQTATKTACTSYSTSSTTSSMASTSTTATTSSTFVEPSDDDITDDTPTILECNLCMERLKKVRLACGHTTCVQCSRISTCPTCHCATPVDKRMVFYL